jgi:hypothetical protein
VYGNVDSISVGYYNPSDGRSQGAINGEIWIASNGNEKGVPAHKFGHGFWGVADAYGSVRMPNGYITEERPFAGFEHNTMGGLGKITGQNLKDRFLKFQSLQSQRSKK